MEYQNAQKSNKKQKERFTFRFNIFTYITRDQFEILFHNTMLVIGIQR